MNTISAIIVDDELHGRIVLKELLGKFCKDVTIAGEAENIEDAYSLIREKKPELVFLDIQMPGGSGFELLKKFSSVGFDVIFFRSME